MGRRFKYNYIDIALPGDLFPNAPTDAMFMQQAFEEARERMKTWAIPAAWTAKRISGEPGESFEVVYRVCRKTHRSK